MPFPRVPLLVSSRAALAGLALLAACDDPEGGGGGDDTSTPPGTGIGSETVGTQVEVEDTGYTYIGTQPGETGHTGDTGGSGTP